MQLLKHTTKRARRTAAHAIRGNTKIRQKPKEQKTVHVFIEVVDETLSILGNPTKEAIYITLQEKYGLKKEDIPDNIEVLESIMHQIFGIAADVIKEEIIRRLKDRLEADPSIEEVSVEDIIKILYKKERLNQQIP